MKILLIEPNIEGNILMPTMSLAILKSFINNKTKHKARIIDLTFHRKEWQNYLLKEINREKPDLIGFSVLSFNYDQALRIASFIKKNFDIRIIFGGVHVILMPDETIKNPEIDIACVGEGEYAIKEILDKKLECKGVKGIWYKENGKIIKNNERITINNLDGLPFPDWSDFDMDKYFLINNYHLPIMASRGCPYSCTYCSNHALRKKLKGRYVRFRSVKNVIQEIELRLKQYLGRGLKYFFFYDDTFILDRDYVLEFCREYKEQGYDKLVRWNVNVRANLVTEDIIRAMKGAGCYEVRMGVEAANDYIRNNLYKRNMSKEEIMKAINIIKRYGLHLRLQFIIGAPYETLDMMKESFDMARKVNADYILFPILMPLPCTEIKDICEKEGLIEEKGFRDSYVMYTHPLSRTKYATRRQIENLVRRIRNYEIKRYFLEGLILKGPLFLWDLFVFFAYYKPRYDLDLDQAYRFTINRYKLEKLK
jgi:radical SAM superfamily enzyme YgiQ (UPF0313 family)